MAAKASDLPLLKKYLAINERKRESMLKALEAKPKLQVHLDLDEGAHLDDSSFQNIRNLQSDLCLAAMTSAIEGDQSAMLRNLKAIMRLVSFDFDHGEYISNKAGIDGRYSFSRVLYRIFELRPDLAKPIADFYFSQPPIAKTNCQRIVESAFLKNIATIRYYDVPGMDKSKPLFQIGERRDEPDPSAGGSAKHDDFIPKSPAVRAYLVKRLQAWWPLIAHQRTKTLPTAMPDFADLEAIQEEFHGESRKYIDLLKGGSELGFGSDSVILTLSRNEQIEDAELLLLKAFDIRRKSGAFPASLATAHINVEAYACLGGAEFIGTNNTFSLSGRKMNGSGLPTVTISFPLSLTISKSSLESARKRLKDYASGKLGSDGFEVSKSGSGGPGIPPGSTSP